MVQSFLTINTKKTLNVYRFNHILNNFKYMSPTLKSFKKLASSSPKLRFGISSKPISPKIQSGGWKKISNGFPTRLSNFTHSWLYFYYYWDPWIGLSGQRKWGQLRKEEKIALGIHADCSFSWLNETFKHAFLVFDFSFWENVEDEEKLRFYEFCAKHP